VKLPASTAIPFDAPSLPPSAHRDRSAEISARAAQQRQSGYEDGYRDGRDAGLRAAADEVAQTLAEHRHLIDRLTAAIHALDAAADDLRRRDHVTIDELEHDAVALAVALAEELVGRELAATDAPVLDALRRAVGLVPDRGVPRVRMHPDDVATATGTPELDHLTGGDLTALVADPTVEPGGCIVDVDACRIDAQLTPALARLSQAV
jgi:flagellar assembly protein FliH